MTTMGTHAMEMGIEPVIKLVPKVERNKTKLNNQGEEELGDDGKPKVAQKDPNVYKLEFSMWM